MRIYAVEISDISEQNLDKLCLLIDLEKKHRIEKFINNKDKIRTTIGEILIRIIIVDELGIESKNINFKKNKYGKPYLKDHQEFNFNISHSGDFVICAIDDKPIGIDIEKIKQIEYKEIAKNYFTVSEFQYIISQDSENNLSKFYEIWTLKESYIKCCGLGLSMPMDSFSIDIDAYGNIKSIIDNENNEYIFKKYGIDLEYKISVCSLGKKFSNCIEVLDQNKLINKYFSLNE